ncbi:MAG: DUF4743 domain-containing protein [Cardiobacteriaceae bacterium]|nr:DUF4743 domain-containing protein [Cardiobacteriaceae bacterium]
MSFLDRLREANNANLDEYHPLFVHGARVGLIWKPQLERIRASGLVLDIIGNHCHWQPPGNFAENSALLADCAAKWHASGLVTGWRDENYAIAASFHDKPVAVIERAAMPILGACGYGVHVNGLTEKNGETHMWLGRRAPDKSTDPDKLDQIAAGGIPHGIGIFANMQKECAEEAALPETLTRNARAVSMTSYLRQTENGIRADILYNYDLWLPPDFIPENRDGEVAEFLCLPLTEIAHLVENSRDIKFNSALVIIDCLIRHGHLTPDHPDYANLASHLNPRDILLEQHARIRT